MEISPAELELESPVSIFRAPEGLEEVAPVESTAEPLELVEEPAAVLTVT
jgi:hypothetical protein